MHHRDDQFTKAILAGALSRAGEAETEVEVPSAPAQYIDVYNEPDPARDAERADMGLLGELGAVPAMFEPFTETPGVRDLRACLRKQYTWHHEQERRARAAAEQPDDDDVEPQAPQAFPSLVILSPGRPETVLATYGLTRVREGLYASAAGFGLRIVVIAELPKTRETLLLRLTSRARRQGAIEEILRLPGDAWERRTSERILVRFDLVPREGASPEETMKGSEILKEGDEIIRRAERRAECRVLLKLLRLKFGELPDAAVSRVDAARAEEIEAWTERVLTAKTLDEVLREPATAPAGPTR